MLCSLNILTSSTGALSTAIPPPPRIQCVTFFRYFLGIMFFFLHFSVKLIEKKTRKSCNSLLVHYNYKIRKLCKLIPFNRYSSILAFFQNLFNCPAVSRKKKSGKIYNIKPVKKTTNHKLAYILYYCGSLKLKSSYCMRTLHMELFFPSILFKKGFISI